MARRNDRTGHLDAGVQPHADARLQRVGAHRQRHDVAARHHPRPRSHRLAVGPVLRQPQVPDHLVEACVAVAFQLAQHGPRPGADRDQDAVGLRTQPVAHSGARTRIRRSIDAGRPALGAVRVVRSRPAHGEQVGAGRHHLGAQLRQRRDVVHDPDAQAVRADHQVVLAGMHDDVVHRHRGQPAVQPAPGRARVDREVHADLVAHEEQVVRGRMLRQRVDRDRGQPVGDPLPALAEVGAGVDVCGEVVVPVAVEGGEDRARVPSRRHDARHVGVRRQVGHVGRQVLPRGASVAGPVQPPVVASRVADRSVQGRLGDRRQVAVAGLAVVAGHLRLATRHAHQRQRVPVDRIGQVRADLGPALPQVGRPEEHVRARVQHLVVMGRQQHRRVPVPPQLALVVVFALRRVRLRLRVRQGPRDGPNPRPLPRRSVHAEQVAALRLGDHHVRVGRVHHREEAVTRAHVVPVARTNPLVRPRVRRRAPRTVVLQAAAYVIRVLHVHADLVELGDRQVAELVPVVGAVPAHRHAAVAAQDQVVRVRRIDPQRMMVQVHAGRRVGSEVAPAVGRPVHAGTAQVHALGVVGVHPNLAVVHGAVVGRAQVLPRLAPVGGTVDSVLALALGRPAAEALPRHARIGFDQREDHVAVAPVDGQPDPPLVALRQSVGQLGPRVAAVGGAVDAAAGSAAVEAPGAPSALVRGREERARVRRVHDQVDGAGVVVDVQDLLPRVAAVGGAVDAPLRVGPPQVADRRHVSHVRIPRVDLNARDVVRVGQPQVRPRAPGVG